MPSGIGVHIRRLTVPVYLPMLLLSVGRSAPIAAFPQYLAGLGASLAVVGVVVSLRGVGNLVSDLPGGLILSRTPLKKVMVLCIVAAAAANTAIVFVRNVAAIGVLVFISGSLTSVVVTAMMTYVRLAVPPDSRGRALSLVGGALRFGMLIGPVAGGLLSDRFGVPVAFALRSACMAAAVASVLSAPDRSIGLSGSDVRPAVREQAGAVVRGLSGRWYALATVGLSILVLQLMRSARTIFLPLWGDVLQLNAATIGAVISAGAAMELMIFVPAGIMMDRVGRKLTASVCIGVFALGVAFIPFTGGLAGLLAASLVIGLGNGFGAGINMTFGTDLAPAGAVSTFLGAWRLFGDVGQAAGPAVVGAMAAAVGLAGSLFVTAGIGAVGLLMIAVLAPETLGMARENSQGP